MLFSYAVRAVYIESCSMFVRGGVYRVVKEAMGGTLAKFSVSALMFDYVLTGPISGVSAGLYLAGLINEIGELSAHPGMLPRQPPISPPSSPILVTLYFWRQEHHGHSRIQREGAAHHAGHHGDGGDADRLVPVTRSSMRGVHLPSLASPSQTSTSARTRWAG